MTMFKPKGKQEFKHPILDFADRRLFLGLVLLPILFDWPAKAVQAGVRTAKYGDPRLVSSPLAIILKSLRATSGFGMFLRPSTAAMPKENNGTSVARTGCCFLLRASCCCCVLVVVGGGGD